MEEIVKNLNTKMVSPEENPLKWNHLPGSFGEYFAIYENMVAGAEGNRLTVWRDGEIILETFSKWLCNGYPQWYGETIYWNNIRVDLTTGLITSATETDNEKGFRPISFSWFPDTRACILTLENTRQKSSIGFKTIMIDKATHKFKIISLGNDLAPKASSVGKECIALGTRGTLICDLEGNKIVSLQGDLPAQRIHFAAMDSLLFTQTFESIEIWNTRDWTKKGRLEGPWLNACINEDGNRIYTIDFGGNFLTAEISSVIGPLKKLPSPAPMATIDTGGNILVASFSRGNPIAWTSIKELDEHHIEYLK